MKNIQNMSSTIYIELLSLALAQLYLDTECLEAYH